LNGRRSAALRERASTVLYPIAAFVLFMSVWEVWVRVGDVSPFILPPPSEIAAHLTLFDQLWPDLRATLGRVVYGFLLAVGVGFVLAVGIVTFRPFARAVYPLLVSTQVVPKLAIAPLFLVWFGYGGLSTILIVFLLAFFPIVINTTLGLRSIEVEKLYLARSIGAGWLSTFLRIRLPNALPSIFGGLKLAALLSVNGAVVAEFISATSGIGRVLQAAAGDVDLVRLFVAIGYLSAVGLAFFLLMELLERLSIPWHASRRDSMVVVPANEAA
jgi:NitT/TauT family transport system permease protein